MNDDYSNMAANGMIHAVQQSFRQIEDCMCEPSVLYRPALSLDGDKWCALYGSNLQDGIAGFGDSPAEAMRDFNLEWHKKLSAGKEKA